MELQVHISWTKCGQSSLVPPKLSGACMTQQPPPTTIQHHATPSCRTAGSISEHITSTPLESVTSHEHSHSMSCTLTFPLVSLSLSYTWHCICCCCLTVVACQLATQSSITCLQLKLADPPAIRPARQPFSHPLSKSVSMQAHLHACLPVY